MATIRISATAVVFAVMTAQAAAQTPSLAGKNVTMIIGFGPATGFDRWGRAVARHIGRHLPGNPTIVPQNMPGAGGFVAANHIYNVAPKDGTAVALVDAATVLGPITGASGARFDPTKFTWLGTPTKETPVCIAFNRPQVKVKTLKDLYENELIVGNAGVGAGPYIYPKALNALLGMKFKIVGGYPSSSAVLLAMERGETEGICQSLDSIANFRPDWIPNKKVTILFQGGVAPNPALKDVPLVSDLAKNPDDKAAVEFLYAGVGFGRPFIAPPGMPADRAKMLQDAFMATMQDPAFIADAKKQTLEVKPENGAHLAALARKIYATQKPIVDRVAELIR
jgi:tripartite-type tricarboxylate transporter receptor subunit TctC